MENDLDLAATLAQRGATALLPVEGLKIHVQIKGFKFAFGNVKLKVIPLKGEGEKWVNATSIEKILD